MRSELITISNSRFDFRIITNEYNSKTDQANKIFIFNVEKLNYNLNGKLVNSIQNIDVNHVIII